MPESPEAGSKAVYVGSFDPITLGHLDIVRRAARIFSEVTVGVGINPDKKSLFSSDERLEMCRMAVREYHNVRVETFNGLAVEFVRQCGSRVLLRGVRSLADMDAEFTMSLTNQALDSEIESVFMMSGERFAHVSSSLIKQIARMARGDVERKLAGFVPALVIARLIERLAEEQSS
ncbi:MAG: pantetheine-phosphate adenylyltransferase [Planctomycetaceae bacterium]|nr:pantetheine-phosphate adenylyltransferase [Planctomycetaceae bacterium]